ncbi:MAG TPA: M23 family metallopeptidase [Candidatus Methylacidiphilales bacterium]|nr:M23 family metallopeptidase [Candidatus Methylacidiphilales bacterium]
MASRLSYLAVLVTWIAVLWFGLDFAGRERKPPVAAPITQIDWLQFFTLNILPSLPVADEFGTPLRPPDGEGVVISMPFMEKGHLGEDWTTAKGDAALGEPVYSVADGWVSVAQNFESAWSNVVFICYRLPEGRYPPFVEVMYAQLATMDVTAGQFVKRGQRIGTVGNVNGLYLAHLHWEVRQTVGLGLGAGFNSRSDGWLNPSDFLVAHRGGRPLLAKPLTPQELMEEEQPGGDRTGWGTDY